MTDLRKLLDAATKGPWKTLDEEADTTYIRIRGAAFGYRYKIANVCHRDIGDHFQEESRANAALIVAAVNALPDLLDVVEAAKTWQSTWESVNGPHGINDVRRYSEAKAALTAALAQWEERK